MSTHSDVTIAAEIPSTTTGPREWGGKSPKLSSKEEEVASCTLLQDYAIAALLVVLAFIQYFINLLGYAFEMICNFFAKLYRFIRFCYKKPQHAKELFASTWRIIIVSYDAELWTFWDIFDIILTHLWNPITKDSTTPTTSPPVLPSPTPASKTMTTPAPTIATSSSAATSALPIPISTNPSDAKKKN